MEKIKANLEKKKLWTRAAFWTDLSPDHPSTTPCKKQRAGRARGEGEHRFAYTATERQWQSPRIKYSLLLHCV